jgi:hypothetical protein
VSTSEIINAIINSLTAIGTIAVAILAIWGDAVRSRIAGPRLLLTAHNLRGSVVPLATGQRTVIYHLKVVNARDWARATNCRVLLRKLWRRAPNGDFQEVALTVPLTFVWSPAEITPPYVNLIKEHVLDFGIVVEGQDLFRPVLFSYTTNFQGFVRANEVIRFGLEIVSDNFVSPRLQVYEVAWNGEWSDNLDTMAHNLQIQEVTKLVSA